MENGNLFGQQLELILEVEIRELPVELQKKSWICFNLLYQRKKEGKENNISIEEIKQLTQMNTTNYDLSKETKADWDFYKYMEHWLEHIIKNNVGLSKYIGYEGNVKNYMKEYFSMDEHKKL